MQILIYTTLFRVHLRIAEDFLAVLALISTENELNMSMYALRFMGDVSVYFP